MRRKQERADRTAVIVLAALLLALIITAMLAPFVLAAYFGGGWLALNYVTVPGFLLLCAWVDVKHGEARDPMQLLRKDPATRRTATEPEHNAAWYDAEWEPCGGGFERRVRR